MSNLPSPLEALRMLADAAEEFASSDPAMPSHSETEQTFERALSIAWKVLASAEGE